MLAVRIALFYPPPWKLPAPGEAAPVEDGPPPEYRDGDLDGDFYQTPYGLLSIAAHLRAHGHEVKVQNLSSYPWAEVERVVVAVEADLYGLSCWTANRRGVALTAAAIRRAHPTAHVVVGGPHASPLAEEMLRHHEAIDTVTVGESELTMLELLARLAAGASLLGLRGAVVRDEGRIVKNPERTNIDELDLLACPQRFFDSHIFMTSRGCPWACTFCGAESQWGRGFRANSVAYTIAALARLVPRLPVKMLFVKDDTFTTNKKRVLELCHGLREKNLAFLWSCDTRVDLLTDELCREMRLAGCERMSLGVESGSPRILGNVDKKITVDEILRSTAMAKKYGIKLRFYMMLGNRGETVETFRETLAFLERARPHEYVFSCLSIYPGTHDFRDAAAEGRLEPEIYFRERFQELKVPYDADPATTTLMNDWFRTHSGLQKLHQPSVAELDGVLAALGEHHAAHLDLAGAHYHEGSLDEAERHTKRALELGHPLPGLALNYLACIAARRGDYDAMMDRMSEAAKRDPQHAVLIGNVNAARRWFRDGGPGKKLPLELVAHHDFRLLERTQQPTLPGPLPEDFAAWSGACEADAYLTGKEEPTSSPHAEVARIGSTKGLEPARRRLPIR